MNMFNQNTDATLTYRETSSANILRTDGTGDTGNLVDFMRDVTITIGNPRAMLNTREQRIPTDPKGSVDAYFSA